MKKRVMTWLLPMLLLLLLPVAAWAADDTLPKADSNGVITLTEDVTLADTYTVSVDTTIDLNGFTLQVDKGIVVSNDSQEVTLTIQDTSEGQKGKVVSTSATRTIDVKSGEAFILKGGTIESFDSTSAVDVRSGATFTMEDGAILGKTTEGSTKNSEGLRTSSTSVATIKKGSISSMKKYAVDAEGIVTIGEANADHALINISGIKCYTKNADLKIYSGHIGKLEGQANKDSVLGGIYQEANIDALPVGKTYKAVSDGFVIENLTEANAVAKIGNDLYASASMAASQLKDGETLILLADVIGDTNDALIKSTKANNVTIDLNGHDVINNNNGAKSKGIVLQGKIQNANGTMAIVNTGNQPVKVQATVPMDLSISDARTYNDTVTIAESIQLICNDGSNNCLVLSNGLILKYSDTLADMIVEGGFKCDRADGSWIYTGIKAAFENDIDHTVELLNAYKATSSITIEGTLDLCGNTITYSGRTNAAIMLDQENQALTVKNGSINATYKYDPNKKPNPTPEYPAPAPYTASGALLMSNNQSLTLDNVKLTTAGGFGISGNGTNENNTITLQNGSVVTTTAEGFPGIYFPCDGTLTIDNSEVHGMANGVQMCDGHLVVRGDKTRITASGNDESTSKTGDGPIPDGAAISIVERGGGYGDVRATIEGGQFESANAEAVNAFTWDAANSTQKDWDNTDKAVQVQGGHFSSSVDESLLDAKLTVELNAPGKNPEAPFSYHPSVEEAYEAAKGDDTATVQPTKPATETVTVTFNLNEGEGAPASVTVDKGGKLAFPTPTREGYTFIGWKDANGNVHQVGKEVTVTEDITFTAVWESSSTGGGTVVKRYDVTLADTDNGSITATHKRASKNSTVTITATPAEGYVVDAVTVTEKDGDKVNVTKKDDNKYTFKMPASDVTVKATFVKDGAQQPEQPTGLPFVDVAKDAWYFPAVEYVFNNGLMNGTTATTFAPNVNLNRAMMAAVLYNMEGKPACDKNGLFSDVENGKWYTEAINWAASNNIVSGMPDGTYAPNQALTREQMASVLYRYAEYKGIDVSSRADLDKFTDGTTVSPWAQDVVQWAVAEKLMSGNGTELQPKGTASRAQVATVLMNYCENVAK